MTATLARRPSFSWRDAIVREWRRNGLRSIATNATRVLRARWMLRKVDELGSARIIGAVRAQDGEELPRANSVVTGPIPPYTVAVGSPARVIRRVHE